MSVGLMVCEHVQRAVEPGPAILLPVAGLLIAIGILIACIILRRKRSRRKR